MNKKEFIESLDNLKECVNKVLNNTENILNPYHCIKNHLDSALNIAEDNGLYTGMDYSGMLENVLYSSIENDSLVGKMNEEFEIFIEDLRNWRDETIGEYSSVIIQEKYIDSIKSTLNCFCIDDIEDLEDFQYQLNQMIESLSFIKY